MNKIIKMCFCFICIIGLYSCEGGTTFTKTIINTTSETLTIITYTIYGSEKTTIISPNEEKEIYWNDFMGRFTDSSYTCTNEFDSIIVTVSNNKTLIKDIMNSDLWERESKDGRNSREDCSITISDKDVE